MDKIELRETLKQKRLMLKESERTLKSRQICERLKSLLDWSAVKSVHYFEPLHYMAEVDLGDLVVWLQDNYARVRLFNPRKIKGDWEMISIESGSPPDNFDVILVPMLGFDNQLNRIGYGGGYYDKFLATQPKAKKVGVCFEIGKNKRLPTEKYDIPLDIIITERTIHRRLD